MTEYATIREVADHFHLPVSTLHYWERCGLVAPARRAGVRIYDAEQVYRIALVDLWRREGHLSIDDIGALLNPRDHWQGTVAMRLRDIDSRIDELERARTYLTDLLGCRHGSDLVHCPDFRDGVSVPPSLQRPRTARAGSGYRD